MSPKLIEMVPPQKKKKKRERERKRKKNKMEKN